MGFTLQKAKRRKGGREREIGREFAAGESVATVGAKGKWNVRNYPWERMLDAHET